tara:strand:- start:11952 stop:12686 length:735 start_codon:yes stop_codon:yes gene_type:complete
MPKIQSIQADQEVNKGDKLLGSDVSGATRNYVISDVTKFFKDTNAAGVAGQFTYQYKTTSPYNAGSMRVTFSSESTFQNATSLKISKFPSGSENSFENLLDIFVNTQILIVDVEDQDNFGVYDTTTVAQDSTETDFYNIAITSTKNNGSLVNEKFYAIISMGGGGADKNDTLSFVASDFDGTETVSGSSMHYLDFTHNLGKKPAITVTEQGSPNEVCLVPVKYINNNTVRVYFTGTTSGTIFAN